MAYVREYREGDAEALAPILREADRNEIQAASGLSPVVSMRIGAEESRISLSIIGDSGHVIGMFGAGDAYPHTGLVWLLGAEELTNIAVRQFVKLAPSYLEAFHLYYPLLFNYIDKRNTVHIRWLKRMGFTFIKEHPEYGHEKRPFLEFVRLR